MFDLNMDKSVISNYSASITHQVNEIKKPVPPLIVRAILNQDKSIPVKLKRRKTAQSRQVPK